MRGWFFGKGRIHPFVHMSIEFWLWTVLQYWSSMSSNSLAFHNSGGISSSPPAFLFSIFLSAESNSSCVNCLSLMSNCLLTILVIGLCIIFKVFLSKFSKCYFHSCIRSCCLVAFAVLFLLFTSFTVCLTMLDCLSSVESPILSIWFCMYSICSFR